MNRRRFLGGSDTGSGSTTDQRRHDSASQDVLEDEMRAKTELQMRDLTASVVSIKQASLAIKGHMIDDESLVGEIGLGLDKNMSVMDKTMTKIDKMLTSASSNVLCYLMLFVVIVLVLLYKLTK